jgi:hypothetical protein
MIEARRFFRLRPEQALTTAAIVRRSNAPRVSISLPAAIFGRSSCGSGLLIGKFLP